VRYAAFEITVSLVLGLLALALGQSTKIVTQADVTSKPSPPARPVYRITFKQSAPVSGVGAVPAMKLPFNCTSDGTVFFDMVPPIGVVGQAHTLPSRFPSLLLLSVSLAGEARSFPLDQVPDLYDLSRIDSFGSDSGVIFLVRAAAEDKKEKRVYTSADGTQQESTVNVADHYNYIVAFDRKGNYQTKVKLETPFEVTRVGVFPSGAFLAYGYETTDKAPKLALLKDDGSLLKFLGIPRGDAPDSAIQTVDGTAKGPLAPVQFSGQGALIYVVQNKSKFPLLEVNEAGAIRAINPTLPEGARINMLIPSDHDLYGMVGDKLRDASIYEVSPQDGSILGLFEVGDDKPGGIVACVHDGKFLSFEHGEGKLVPLIGTAEPPR
jgi:hypothetical protein